MLLEEPIRRLLDQFCKLPGVGERTALRLVLHLFNDSRESIEEFAACLQEVAHCVRECQTCCSLTVQESQCKICNSPSREQTTICVVANVQDLMAIESTGEFRGLYHVLHGNLSPMDGIGPQQLRIQPLLQRLTKDPPAKEVILATPSNVEGEATALYLIQQLQPYDIRVTRIASGVPVGGELQFADRLTLSRSLASRQTTAPALCSK
ncbi:MAG: recombination mediator RecR [Myxococcota bacterium]